MNKFYAGIGSRETPNEILNLMKSIAVELERYNFVLRSGRAIGADQAFESGAIHKDIFLKEDATFRSMEISSLYHPYWHRLRDYEKQLHGRNAQILLGEFLDSPVDFIICWTKDAKVIGGTGQALRMAKGMGIKVYNLASEKDFLELNSLLSLLNRD